MDIQALKNVITQAQTGGQKINAAGFEKIRAEVLKDQQVSPEESQVLMDSLTQNAFDRSVVPSVILFVSQGLQAPSPVPEAKPTPAPTPSSAASEKPTEKAPEPEKKSPWKSIYTIQGNANYTSVSDG